MQSVVENRTDSPITKVPLSQVTPIGSLRKSNGAHPSPGLLACFSLFGSLIGDIKFLIHSFKTKDNEGKIEGFIRVLNLPIGIASSLERLISFFMAIAAGVSIATLSVSAAVTGFIFLTIEFGLEVYRLIRTLVFTSKYDIRYTNKLINELNNKKTNLNKFRQKHGLFPEDSIQEMQTKLANRSIDRIKNDYFNCHTHQKLDRIIRPFAVDLLKGDSDKVELIKLLNSQINKTILVNIIGLTAILLATASLALCFLGCPPMIFVTIGLIGIAIEFTRYLAPSVLLDHAGWRPHFYACLPKCCQPKSLSRQ